jgi:hypothetical protein
VKTKDAKKIVEVDLTDVFFFSIYFTSFFLPLASNPRSLRLRKLALPIPRKLSSREEEIFSRSSQRHLRALNVSELSGGDLKPLLKLRILRIHLRKLELALKSQLVFARVPPLTMKPRVLAFRRTMEL